MALTGLDIYKLLPKTNCAKCGVPTCLAFAMKLASGAATLDTCPDVSEEAKAALSSAAAPPMRKVTIGTGEKAISVGEELVMYRHEKTFVNSPGLALYLSDTMDDATIDLKLQEAVDSSFDRIGQTLRGHAIAVDNKSGDEAKYLALIEKAKTKVGYPLILMVTDAAVADKALEKVAADKPLLYAATKDNYEAFAGLATKHAVSLAVKADNLDELADISAKVSAAGVKDIILDPGSRHAGETHKNLVQLRRAALKQKFKDFGYPVIVFPNEESEGDELMETMFASAYISKYGNIVMLSGFEPWKVMSLATLIQNVYTDPQRPMQVEEGIYPIGNPGPNSPVMLTTNFSLTYFIVTGEVESSKVDSWLCVMAAEGMSVLTAWAAGKFTPEKIATFIKKSGVNEKVGHNKLIIPGYVAQISGELAEELPEWEVQVGVREAGDIGHYLRSWSSDAKVEALT